jgi:hypothetical protein
MTGCVARATPSVALVLGCVVMTNFEAVPAVNAVALDAVALVRPVAEKVSVSLPTRPVIFKPEKVATPLVKVAVAFVSVPVPVDTVAVTVPVALVTGLPLASSAVTTGCVARATPLDAVVLGCVVITN